jgi:hypothetical protein
MAVHICLRQNSGKQLEGSVLEEKLLKHLFVKVIGLSFA